MCQIGTTILIPRKARVVAEFSAAGCIAIDDVTETFFVFRPDGAMVGEFPTIGDAIVRCLNNAGWGEHSVTLM